jgi:hypothetical protein
MTVSLAAAVAIAMTVSGCGFVHAASKSDTKPSAFVLIGHAEITLPTTEHRAAGTTCQAPAGTTDVAPNTQVTVTDQGGHQLAVGFLGDGVIARSGSTTTCQFPFSIRGVPGGIAVYSVAVGNRPAETFQGDDLNRNTPAVIAITP